MTPIRDDEPDSTAEAAGIVDQQGAILEEMADLADQRRQHDEDGKGDGGTR